MRIGFSRGGGGQTTGGRAQKHTQRGEQTDVSLLAHLESVIQSVLLREVVGEVSGPDAAEIPETSHQEEACGRGKCQARGH